MVGGRPVTETDSQQQQLTARCTATALQSIALHCTALAWTALHCFALQRDSTAIYWSRNSSLPAAAPRHSSPLYSCTALQLRRRRRSPIWLSCTLQTLQFTRTDPHCLSSGSGCRLAALLADEQRCLYCRLLHLLGGLLFFNTDKYSVSPHLTSVSTINIIAAVNFNF